MIVDGVLEIIWTAKKKTHNNTKYVAAINECAL